MHNRLKRHLSRQNFYPTFTGVFLNPFYIARRGLVSAVKDLSPVLNGHLLDVGCGSKPYESLFDIDSYTGLDIETEVTHKRGIADHFYNGDRFPFDDDKFDSVLCNQVLEHVFNPDDFLSEIYRVLKPGGKLLLTVPFVWDEHEQPYDYARYSSFGLSYLIEKNGFKIIEQRKIGADASTLFQLTNAYLYKIILSWPKLFRFYMNATLMALISILGITAGKVLPSNSDLFRDNIILAKK